MKFFDQFHEVFDEAFVQDDPSVGIFSEFESFYRTGPSTWVVEGGGETYVIAITSIKEAADHIFEQGRAEGMMDEALKEEERLEKEREREHIMNCEICS